ncbi:Hypothetical protein BN2458_PEG0596 [Helicobacter typhlonius]|uniref:Uncharacterized protein n=1 Tax=Helicobacter typhlonius TaxID=76936 RepID=A0A0S4PU99_9HELI|nr:Hypothetical protein BN2458_PEG0596 [Helicobacter typhlonius]
MRETSFFYENYQNKSFYIKGINCEKNFNKNFVYPRKIGK